MFAIIESGSKQYRVEVGDVIEVELLPETSIKKHTVTLDAVLLVKKDSDIQIGTPFVTNAKVKAKVLDQIKDDKIIVFKKKSKKQFRRTRGHRQCLHQLKIEKIEIKEEKEQEKESE